MSKRKKQPKKGKKSPHVKRSRPVKSTHKGNRNPPREPRKAKAKKPTHSPPKKQPVKKPAIPPAGFYYAHVNAKGQRVKGTSKGAKRIAVKINRAALQEHGKRSGRIGGKFAPKSKAIAHNRRKQAAKKAALTRALKKRGGEFHKKYTTEFAHFEYREYTLQDYSPETIEAARLRELEEGYGIFRFTIDYTGEDGLLQHIGTGWFKTNNPKNSFAASQRIEILINKYDVGTVERIIIHFSKQRTG